MRNLIRSDRGLREAIAEDPTRIRTPRQRSPREHAKRKAERARTLNVAVARAMKSGIR